MCVCECVSVCVTTQHAIAIVKFEVKNGKNLDDCDQCTRNTEIELYIGN